MNYTALRNAIIGFTNNNSSEFSAMVDTLISLGETRLVRATDLREYRKHATALATPSDPYLTLPSNVLQVRYLRIRTGDFLESRPESFMSEYNQTVTTSGTPKYYGHWDSNTVVLAPAPSSPITLELSYKQKPASIVTATNTWLGDNAEDALLYACLYESGLFLQYTQDIIAPIIERYKECLAELNKQEETMASDEFMSRGSI